MQLLLERGLELEGLLLDFVLQVAEDSQEEVSFKELILVLETGSFDELANGAETLRDSVVVFYVDKMIFVFLVLVFEDLPDAASDVEVGCG